MSRPAVYDHIEEVVTACAPSWQVRLGLAHWEIQHIFLDEFDGDDPNGNLKVTAYTEVRWNYEQAEIRWYLPSAARATDSEIERVVVHELVHVLLSPEQADIPDKHAEKMELSTERVTRAFLNIWRNQ